MRELAGLAVPVVVDIGSGLLDDACPWLVGGPPAWLAGEPAARQTLAAGAALGDVQRRQAPRRSPGRDHRRPGRPRRPLWRPSPRPSAPAGRSRARRAAGRRTCLPPSRRPGAALLASGHGAARRAPPASRRARRRTSGGGGRRDRGAARRGRHCRGAPSPRSAWRSTATTSSALRALDPPIVARVQDGRTVLDLRTVEADRRSAPGRGVERSGRRWAEACTSSPPPVTSTTGSRRSCWPSRGPIPTASRRRSAAASRSTSGSPTPRCRRGRDLVRGRARPRPLPQEHAGRRRVPSTPACSWWLPTRAGNRSPKSTCGSSNCSASATASWRSRRSTRSTPRGWPSPTSTSRTTSPGRSWRGPRSSRWRPPRGSGLGELREALDRLLGGHAAGRRPHPAAAVGRSGLRRPRRRHRRDRHARRRPGRGGRRHDRRTDRPGGAGAGHPDASATRSTSIGPGHRVALNLSGVEHTQVVRGDAVISPGQWRPTRRFDATLTVLAGARPPVSPAAAPTSPTSARASIRCASGSSPGPRSARGTRAWSGCTSRAPSRSLPGDRYVLRESGRSETVGGGEVLDVAPVLPASKARPDRSVDRVIAERGWIRGHRPGGPDRRAAGAHARSVGRGPRGGRGDDCDAHRARGRRWAARPRRGRARRARAAPACRSPPAWRSRRVGPS